MFSNLIVFLLSRLGAGANKTYFHEGLNEACEKGVKLSSFRIQRILLLYAYLAPKKLNIFLSGVNWNWMNKYVKESFKSSGSRGA